jgi:hypothetical protein
MDQLALFIWIPGTGLIPRLESEYAAWNGLA